MISDVVEPQRWSASRWWALILFVLVGQIGIIFWLGKPQAPAPPSTAVAPLIQLASSGSSNLLALSDPTLFALPHQQGFSGQAWLTIPEQDSFVRPESVEFLSLMEGQLGAPFRTFMASNAFDSLPSFEQFELGLRLPRMEQMSAAPEQSTLQLAGPLINRRLLTIPSLPPWPSTEILTNSVVQILIAADGTPISAILLKREVQNEADRYALGVARHLHFESLKNIDPTDPMAGLTWGQLVFWWKTVPLPTTNNPVEPTPTK